MKRFSLALMCVAAMVAYSARHAAAQHALEVISYDPGATATAGYTNSAASLGAPERFSGEGVFPGVVSPFNPPFLNSELVAIGEGGQLTLRLSHYAIPQAGAPEIGLFSNTGIIDTAFPNGMAGSPIAAFGINSATVEVSEDGSSWTALSNVLMNMPTNGYTDLVDPFASAPGSVPSDFQQPFTGSLIDFAGLKYSDAGGPDILELLAGSGGGKWIDISGAGLPRVGFVRLGLVSDVDAIDVSFELDAVSISHAALGPATVPEPATVSLVGITVVLLSLQCGRRRRRRE